MPWTSCLVSIGTGRWAVAPVSPHSEPYHQHLHQLSCMIFPPSLLVTIHQHKSVHDTLHCLHSMPIMDESKKNFYNYIKHVRDVIHTCTCTVYVMCLGARVLTRELPKMYCSQWQLYLLIAVIMLPHYAQLCTLT